MGGSYAFAVAKNVTAKEIILKNGDRIPFANTTISVYPHKGNNQTALFKNDILLIEVSERLWRKWCKLKREKR